MENIDEKAFVNHLPDYGSIVDNLLDSSGEIVPFCVETVVHWQWLLWHITDLALSISPKEINVLPGLYDTVTYCIKVYTSLFSDTYSMCHVAGSIYISNN
ncbi:hypothetical protein EB796_000663 [Bugula neritina]|uniref:Uncharacterized protein n=1 Tax=Bugula neritina TaxID=10212 RepID=A0A7J7KS70_BUGNE|nr:hypothetical protein EB796_000663 [Bugula neritina]